MLGVIAFFLELHYWKDLTVTGYLWILVKPLLLFVTTLFMLSNGGPMSAESFWGAYLWSMYWAACMSSVSNSRRLRRFFRYGTFRIPDLLTYTVVDYLFVSVIVALILLPMSLYLGFGMFDIKYSLLVLMVFFIQSTLLVYIGMLSVNALDISYVFMFAPMLFLVMFINETYTPKMLLAFPYFYFLVNAEVSTNYLITFLAATAVVSTTVLIYLNKNYQKIYRNSIA